MKKVLDFFINFAFKVAVILVSIPFIFIFIPLKLIIGIIGNLVLLVIGLIKKIKFRNKDEKETQADFGDKGKKVEEFFTRLTLPYKYHGDNKVLQRVDQKIISKINSSLFLKTISMFLVSIPILLIYMPIRLLVRLVAKLALLIIIGIKMIMSRLKKSDSNKLPEFGKAGQKIEKFFTYLSIKHHYRGKNQYFKNVDRKIMTNSSLLYIEIIAFILLVLFFAPFALVIVNATKTANEITFDPLAFASDSTTFLKNLTNILTSTQVRYWESFFNSLIITSGSLITIGVFSGMAAWVLVRTKKLYARLIFVLFLSGMVIPFQVVMLPLVRLLEVITSNSGIAMKDTFYGVILVYIGFGAPLSVFMLHGFIKSIPMDIEEAAIIDGCSKTQLFFKIILPILKPIFVTLLVLNGLWIWNDYLLPSLVIGMTGDVRTLPLAVANLAGAYVKQWDLLLTSVLLAAIPVVILFLFAQKYIIKGMTSGAIK
jgi:raffinose/stachyose/melibiose transport system permease protein